MLSDFIDLQEGDWVVQNGANSAVSHQLMCRNLVDATIMLGWSSCHSDRGCTTTENSEPCAESVSSVLISVNL